MINQDMTIKEVLDTDRGTAAIFMGFGMHCLGCPHATGESLLEACAAHGVSAEPLVKALNEFLAGK